MNSNANQPIKAVQLKIKIDKEDVPATKSPMTGTEILALVNKTPDKWLLRMKFQGKVLPVEPEELVEIDAPGVERFMTVPKTVQEGDSRLPRREFQMMPADVEYLDSLGLKWECVKEGPLRVIIIYAWGLAAGYNVPLADVHLRLSDLYPDTEIDMAYFSPALARADGRSINGLSALQCDGRTWQQWSRHRTAESKWRGGEDNVSTHMALVEDWLRAELRK